VNSRMNSEIARGRYVCRTHYWKPLVCRVLAVLRVQIYVHSTNRFTECIVKNTVGVLYGLVFAFVDYLLWMDDTKYCLPSAFAKALAKLWCLPRQSFVLCRGPVWFPVLGSTRKLWPLIMVLNKASLQNQLQNPCARNPEEYNEAFDRVIRG